MRSFYYHVVKGNLVVRKHRPAWAKGYFTYGIVKFRCNGFVYEVASNESVPQIVGGLIFSLIDNCQWDRLNNLKHYMKYLKEYWREIYL
jgi:hypothetical protein